MSPLVSPFLPLPQCFARTSRTLALFKDIANTDIANGKKYNVIGSVRDNSNPLLAEFLEIGYLLCALTYTSIPNCLLSSFELFEGGRDDDGKARVRNGDVNEQDDIRPAARRNERNEMGSFTGGEQLVQKGGNGRNGEDTFITGRGGSSRQFNRTFNNSKRNSGRDDYKEKEVPKR